MTASYETAISRVENRTLRPEGVINVVSVSGSIAANDGFFVILDPSKRENG